MEPRPRRGAYDAYWHFAAERQRIFTARAAGQPSPWTDDRILSTFKFCNVFRAADRVSQFLIREVCYEAAPTAEDLVFQIVLFRTFSKESTWEGLVERLGRPPLIDDLYTPVLETALDDIKGAAGRLYTGAFILCATDAFGMRIKHLNHIELFREMFIRQDLPMQVLEAESLREVYLRLHAFPLMGDFMSYQIAIDLNYSDLLNFSEDEFTQPGPGALRGIAKAFEHLGTFSPADVIRWMVDRQEREFDQRGLQFPGLWGRRIHAIDAQNLFCETDKYLRESMPELTSSRSRIKAKYTPSTRSEVPFFFPPKWGINDRIGHAQPA